MIIECEGVDHNWKTLGNLDGTGNAPGLFLSGEDCGPCYGIADGAGSDRIIGTGQDCHLDSNYLGTITGEGK
jgi:hypothetical protein